MVIYRGKGLEMFFDLLFKGSGRLTNTLSITFNPLTLAYFAIWHYYVHFVPVGRQSDVPLLVITFYCKQDLAGNCSLFSSCPPHGIFTFKQQTTLFVDVLL